MSTSHVEMPDRNDPDQEAAPQAGGQSPSATQAWLARLALLAALAAVAVLVVGSHRAVGLVIAVVIALACVLAGVWWFLSRTGPVRWIAAGLVLAAPITLAVLCIVRNQVVTLVVAIALVAIAVASGGAAMVRARPPAGMPERKTAAPHQPFVIMNPRSGGGKVGRFDLVAKATALGARVELLEGPGVTDVAALARGGIVDGADMLGVAGGDGTQALVAGIAAEHGLPFLVISAGTRNHFAMDLGLDRERPDASLDALTDGIELILDLGSINGRTFVNNASFGAYAEVVQSPAYRDDKAGTTLRMLPDLLSGHSGPRLSVRIDDLPPIEGPQAVLVSNNPYETGDFAGLGRRARIDTGALGVIVVAVDSAAQAAELVRGRRSRGVRRFQAREVVIDADVGEIPVGIDGEAVSLTTPVRCTIRPQVLRVRVPRNRPGVPLTTRLDGGDLLRLALNRPVDPQRDSGQP
jgi:diacylglycerol kinase family enzyme